MRRNPWIFTLLVVLRCIFYVQGQAKLIDPPSRSTMWRYGFNVPQNKQDGHLNCGGINTLKNNGGKCGLCGDNYNAIRENEYKGKYAKGIIGKNYTEGETIRVTIQFVIGRPGFFEFRLCKIQPGIKEANQDCFDSNILKTTNGSTKMQIGSPINKNVSFELILPKGLVCSRCVLQWTYTTSVVYGCNSQNDCCFGCGIQEKYVNCADVSINPSPIASFASPTTDSSPPSSNNVDSTAPISSNIQDLLNTQKSQLATLAKLKAEMAKLQDIHDLPSTAAQTTKVVTTPVPTTRLATTTPPPTTVVQVATTALPPSADPQNFQDFVKAFFSVTNKLQGGPQSPSEIMDVLGKIKLPKPTTQSPIADAEKFLTNLLFQNKNTKKTQVQPLPQQPMTGYPPGTSIVPQPTVDIPHYPGIPQQSIIPGMQPSVSGVRQQPNGPGMPSVIPSMPQARLMNVPGMPYSPRPQFPSQFQTSNPFGASSNPFQYPPLSGNGIQSMEAGNSAAADLLGIDLPSGMNPAALESIFNMMSGSMQEQNALGEIGQMSGLMNQFSKMMSQTPSDQPAMPAPTPPETQPQIQPPPPPPQVPAPAPNPPTNLVTIASLPPLTIDTISDSQRTDILEKLKLANVVMSKQVPPVGFNEKLEAYRIVIDTALKKYNDERDKKLLTKHTANTVTTSPGVSNVTTQNPQILAQQKQISELRQELQRLKNLTVNKPTQLTPQSNPYTTPVRPQQQFHPNNPPMSEVQLLDSLFGSGSPGSTMGFGGPGPVAPFVPGQGSAHPLHSRPIDFNSYDPFSLMGGGIGGLGIPGLGFGLGEPVLKCDFVGTGEIEWPCMRYCRAEAMTCVPKRQFPQFRKRCATDCAIL